MMNTPVIAIDGHAGAGKSTVADIVADQLGFWHVNTGLYYRAVTCLAQAQGLDLTQETEISQLAQQAEIDVRIENEQERLYANGEDISDQIRTPAINNAISQVSAYRGVRDAITRRLQALIHSQGLIMDGRDIGTVVYPQATLKIFLTASVDERASRQFQEARAKGHDVSLESFKQAIIDRDTKDSQREVAPLKQAEDAVLVDSTAQSPAEVAEQVMQLWQQRCGATAQV